MWIIWFIQIISKRGYPWRTYRIGKIRRQVIEETVADLEVVTGTGLNNTTTTITISRRAISSRRVGGPQEENDDHEVNEQQAEFKIIGWSKP